MHLLMVLLSPCYLGPRLSPCQPFSFLCCFLTMFLFALLSEYLVIRFAVFPFPSPTPHVGSKLLYYLHQHVSVSCMFLLVFITFLKLFKSIVRLSFQKNNTNHTPILLRTLYWLSSPCLMKQTLISLSFVPFAIAPDHAF